MRLFFALWPDDATRAALAERSRAIHRLSGGRAMRAESLHITLAFLGETEAARLQELTAAAARVPMQPFVLMLDQAGYWRHNKIAWIGATQIPPGLGSLVAQLRGALTDTAFRFDPKPFVPHITLVRNARPGFRLPAIAAIEWPVREFALVQTVPTANGSDYTIYARWG